MIAAAALPVSLCRFTSPPASHGSRRALSLHCPRALRQRRPDAAPARFAAQPDASLSLRPTTLGPSGPLSALRHLPGAIKSP
jgi:hypothetical protein